MAEPAVLRVEEPMFSVEAHEGLIISTQEFHELALSAPSEDLFLQLEHQYLVVGGFLAAYRAFPAT